MKNSFKYIVGTLILALLSTLYSPVIGQSLTFGKNSLKSMKLIESGTSSYLVFFCNNYYLKYDTKQQKIIDSVSYQTDSSNLDITNIITNYKSLVIGEKIYFIENIGGGVVEFYNGKFSRIDNSYTHRLQFGSSLFVYKNIIHQFGGYGFFSNRDFITYFDTTTKSWEVVNPIKSKEIPIGTSSNITMLLDSNLYIFNGFYIDKFDRNKINLLNEIWQFNFSNNEWKLIGKMNKDQNISHNRYFEINNEIIIINYNGYLGVLNIKNNKIKKFKKTKFIDNLSELIDPIYKGGLIYCITNNEIKNRLELHIREKDEFLGSYIEESKFYTTGFFDQNKYIFLIFVIGIILIVSIIIIKRRNKIDIINRYIKLRNDKIYFKNKLIDLGDSEIKIMKKLLEKPNGVTSSEIMILTETKGLNYSHNIRQKNNKINDINLIFKANLKIDYDVITSSKSTFDQRMRIYKLNIKDK